MPKKGKAGRTGSSKKLLPVGGGGSELAATLTKGQIGDPEMKEGEWSFLLELNGKAKDLFSTKERNALNDHYKDKLTMLKKAAVLLNENPKLKEQYRGRVHDLADDLYAHTIRKAADKQLEPIVNDVLNKAAEYVGGGGDGVDAVN